MRVSPLYNIVKKSYSFEGCAFSLFCTICAFMTGISFIFCDTFGFIGFLTVKLAASEKSITVRKKNRKNEQQQSNKERTVLKWYYKIIHQQILIIF